MEPDVSRAEEDHSLLPLLASATLELIPTKSAAKRASDLSDGTRVSITASPRAGLEATLELTAELVQQRLQVTPHLSATLIRDRAHLESVIETLDELHIDSLLVLGGDGEPVGSLSDARSLLREIDAIGRHFSTIGVGCYPEGHPTIDDDSLVQSLRDKQDMATHMTSQMCFDIETISSWAVAIRNEGVVLPLHIGLPGVVDPIKLAGISARIGVGQSLRFVAKNRRLAAKFIRPGGYDPTVLVRSLASALADSRLSIEGLHIFTFNQVAATEDWRQGLMAGK